MRRIANFVLAMFFFLFLIVGLWPCFSEAGSVKQTVDYQKHLNDIEPGFMITAAEAYQWHLYKDKGGPTFSGNASWRSYMKNACRVLISG